MAEIVQYTTNELMQEEDYNIFLYVLANKKKYELFEKKLKQALLSEMESKGITSYEDDKIKVTYKAGSTRKSVDTEALKSDGLYEMYTKESNVSPSVSISVK